MNRLLIENKDFQIKIFRFIKNPTLNQLMMKLEDFLLWLENFDTGLKSGIRMYQNRLISS